MMAVAAINRFFVLRFVEKDVMVVNIMHGVLSVIQCTIVAKALNQTMA